MAVNENYKTPAQSIAAQARATSTPQIQAAQAASNAAAALQAKYAAAQKTVVSDLNSGNYAGAFSAAEAPGLNSSNQNGATNPLLTQLDTSQGLQALDPTLKWTPQSMQAYYSAAMAPTNWNASVMGANPDGSTLWGSNATGKAASDAATNSSTSGDNSAPDIARFAGKQPDPSFLAKWGAPIAEVALAAVAPEVIPALAGALGGGTLAGIAAGGAFGAGSGAITGALSGGNIGKSALLGGIGGGITGGLSGSGITGTGQTYLTDVYGVPQTVANGLVQGVEGAGIGAIKGAVGGTGAGNGALVGGLSGAASGAINGAMQGATNQNVSPVASVAGNVAGGIIGSKLAQPYLSSPSAPAAPAPAAAPPTSTAASLPSLPGQSAPPAIAAPGSMGSTNIGSYSGYGYQPRQEANMAGTNWAQYGTGPEQQFFQPVGSTPTAATPNTAAQPIRTAQLTGINQQNSI